MATKEKIFVRPPRRTDRFNDPIGDLAPWQEIPGATVVPRSSQEDDRRGPVIIAGYMVALPGRVFDATGEPVTITDTHEVQIRGDIYQIDGAVANYGRKIIFYTMKVK